MVAINAEVDHSHPAYDRGVKRLAAAGVFAAMMAISGYVLVNGSEIFSPFIIEHDLNMGSTGNMFSSLAFVKLFQFITIFGTVAAGVGVTRAILKR